MPRKLTPHNGGETGRVTLRKEDLEIDGLVDEDGNVESACFYQRRIAPGRYELVFVDEANRPLDADMTGKAESSTELENRLIDSIDN